MSIQPFLTYADAHAAIAFLCDAFGFTESWRLEMGPGVIGHAELVYGDAPLALASEFKGMGLQAPGDAPTRYSQLQVLVDDVDAHYARAVAHGATVAGPPETQPHGHRQYRATDLEGHRWIFSQQLESLTPAEILARYST